MTFVRPSVTLIAVTLALAATLLVLYQPATSAQDYVELPPELEARAASLYAGIMCPQCNGQTISQSHSPIAETMRGMVREQLLAGSTDKEIYEFMVRSFDEAILAEPPKSGVALGVWVIPPVALALGAFVVYLAIRRMRSAAEEQWAPGAGGRHEDAGPEDPETEQLLRLVDREMSGSDAGESR